jgi:hypothetical protein
VELLKRQLQKQSNASGSIFSFYFAICFYSSEVNKRRQRTSFLSENMLKHGTPWTAVVIQEQRTEYMNGGLKNAQYHVGEF